MSRTYFEDLVVGDTFGGESYEVPADEMLAFARKWDPRPVHLEQDAARDAGFEGVIASGAYVTSILTLLTSQARKRSGDHAVIAALASSDRRPTSVGGGDILEYTGEIIAKRESKSRPDAGIVTTRALLTNQRGDVVLDAETVTLVERRP